MAFHNSGRISTNGLVLCLDAGNPRSYVSGSTNWFDLSGNNNSGSLINGPVYTGSNGGAIVFDGVDDYVSLKNLSINYPFNISIIATEPSGSTGGGPFFGFCDTTSDNSLINLQLYITLSNVIRVAYYSTTTGFTSVGVSGSVDTNYIVSANFTTSSFDLYVNGTYRGSLTGSFSKVWTDTAGSYNISKMNRSINPFYGKGSVYSAYVYNRALSAQEVKNNYDAVKSRYGLT